MIVVDDGSSDATAAIIAALPGPIALIRQANAGPGAATTRGLAEVSTPLIATLEADALWRPGQIAAQISYLAAHPDAAAVFCRMSNFRDTSDPLDRSSNGGRSRSSTLKHWAGVSPLVVLAHDYFPDASKARAVASSVISPCK